MLSGLCLLTGMIVFTAIMTPATGNKPMVFFDLLQHGITSVGKSRRSAPPNHPKLTAIEKEAVARFQYSFYLGWMSCLLLICVSVFNSVIALRKKRDTTSQIALKWQRSGADQPFANFPLHWTLYSIESGQSVSFIWLDICSYCAAIV